VRAFAAHVVPGANPVFVEVRPRNGALASEGFANVRAQVAAAGGSTVHGWTIWEWPSVMIEAEFHAVWKAPDGRLLDVSPPPHGERRMVFIPDPNRVFEGRQIPNVRAPLADDPTIREFITLSDEISRWLNTGEREYVFGEIPVDEITPLLQRKAELQDQIARRSLGPDSPCPCGSGRQYKHCHGA
jgi:SEC-C motif